MARLSISLLGHFRAVLDGQPVTGFKSNRVRALLAYLATESDRPHPRETLAGLLWPDWSNREAISNLRYTLFNLRQTIGDHTADPPFLLVERDSLAFNPASDSWVDVQALAQLAQKDVTDPATMELMEQAVSLYQGSFLEGFSLEDSPAFDDWTLMMRERFARQISSILHSLATTYEQLGKYEPAQSYIWRQLELEPWDESANRQLMRLLALSGQRSAALEQYEDFRTLLKKELGVEPDEKTKIMYEQIRDGKLIGAAAPYRVETSGLVVTQPRFMDKEPPNMETPVFVARENELARLEGFLSQALSGQGRVVFVTGEAGSGKTSLIQAFTQKSQAAYGELVVAGGDCNAYTGIGDPYLPFREILDLLTGGVEAKWSAGAITKEHACRLWNMLPHSVQALMDVGPDLIDTFVLRGALLEHVRQYMPTEKTWQVRLNEFLEHKPATGLSVVVQQQSNLFEQYTRVLQALAQEHPLLLVLDDLQWADLGSISLLFHLGRRLSGSRILIVGAYRSEEVALWKDGKRHALESAINEFRQRFGDILVDVDQSEHWNFIDSFLDSEPNRLGMPFRQMLYQQTRGHPLFTIELLRGLQERGDLVKDADGYWIEGSSLDWETLPVRVEAVIRERIDRLPDVLQKVLSVASVEGEQFTAEVIARIQSVNENDMLDHLSSELDRTHRLVRAQSVQRVNGQLLSCYRFRHILFQKYLYGSLDEVERVHLHEQVGNALETMYKAREDESGIALQLAHHFEKARATGRAVHYLQRVGDRALQLSAYEEAIAHLNRGLTLLETQHDSLEHAREELNLQLSLAMALQGAKGVHSMEVENVYARARELCQRIGNIPQMVQVLGGLTVHYYVRAEHQRARKYAEETLLLAESTGEPLLALLCHWYLGFILFCLGDFATAREHLKYMIDYYEPQKHHRLLLNLRGSDAGLSALAYDACCLWCLGYPDQALKRSQEALSLARELDHPFSLADVLCFGGCMFNSMRRDVKELMKDAEDLMSLSSKIHLTGWLASAIRYQGEALVLLGKFKEGVTRMQEGIAMMHSQELNLFITETLAYLAWAQANTDAMEEGIAALNEAIGIVEKTDERQWEAEIYRIKGELLLKQGKEDEAEINLQKAVEVARRQCARSWEVRAMSSLCRLWQKQGKKTKAQQELADIYNWFTEGFDTPDLIDAKKLLEELSD